MANEIVNFDKWTRKALGDPLIDDALNNSYLNIGEGRNIIKYVFDNLYEPKFVELVKYNLKNNFYDESIKNDHVLELKKKRQELIDRKAKLKAQIELEENDINSISNDIFNLQATKDSNEIDLKFIENTIQEEYLNEAKHLLNSFDFANKRLNSLINSDQEMTTSKKSVEKVLIQIQNTIKKKQQKTFENEDALNDTLKKLDLKNTIEILNEINKEEVEKIKDNILSFNAENEIQLIKYKIENAKLIDSNEQETLMDSLNKINMDFIEKKCDIVAFNKKEELLFQQVAPAFNRLLGVLGHDLSQDKRVIMYLNNWLSMKRVEVNYMQYELFSRQIENELNQELNKEKQTQEKLNRIKKLFKTIEKNKDVIQNLYETNSSLTERPFSLQADLEDNIQTIPEFLRSLELNQTIMDDYLLNDFEKFKYKFKQLNEFISNLNEKSDELKELSELIKISMYHSKKTFLNELIEFTNKLTMVNLNEIQTDSKPINLKQLLQQCKEFDKIETKEYLNKLNTQIEKVFKFKNNLKQYEIQLDIWWNQPGAYNCIFKNRTVDGNTLGYYLDLVKQHMTNSRPQFRH